MSVELVATVSCGCWKNCMGNRKSVRTRAPQTTGRGSQALKGMDRTGVTTDQGGALEGVLIVHKEAGWTSHDVVAKVRSLLRGSKIGHAGTLDPSATGVLPILVGRATRIAEYLIDWDKEYRAVLRLGETTDTQDATGQILTKVNSSEVTEDVLQAVLARFR